MKHFLFFIFYKVDEKFRCGLAIFTKNYEKSYGLKKITNCIKKNLELT